MEHRGRPGDSDGPLGSFGRAPDREARAALICPAVLDGVATKNSLIGSEVPGVGPLAQLAPDALVRSDGRNTW